MEDSVFTKIIKGEIPCHKVYEDDQTIAFLTIDPLTPGHTLVVPKQQIDHLWDIEDEIYQYLMAVAKRVALRIREVLSPERVGMAVEGFGVPHTHIHVFALDQSLEKTIDNHLKQGKQEPDHDALAFLAQKLAF